MNDSEWPTQSVLDRLGAHLELVRAPNLFTAMADVVAGFLFTHSTVGPQEGWTLGFLLAASTSLYAAGVVLNDVYDLEIDRRERPERPLPSGQIAVGTARRLGWGSLLVGMVLAAGASLASHRVWPAVVGCLLAAGIVLYDGYLKRTPLGPVAMGACRAMNLLLGMSAAAPGWQDEHWLIAAAMGVYVTGITLLARGETQGGRRGPLALATGIILAGFALLFVLPKMTDELVLTLLVEPQRWYILLAVLGAYAGLRCLRAVFEPDPDVIQAAVKHCLVTLVFLDAAICYVKWDLLGAVIVLALLAPIMILGRWIRST